MLILVVVERRRDIAILCALLSEKASCFVFVIEGALVGAIGALTEPLFLAALCAIGNYFKVVSLPADVYSISAVPLNARISETLIAE